MISETITKNDLTAILNEVLPPTPSEYKKLLWTNSSPTSDFVAQTITMDLTAYDEVEVWFNCWKNRPNTSLQIRVKKGTYGIATQGASTNTSSGINPFVVGSYIIVQDRPIYVTDTGVQFGVCTEGASNGTMYNSNSSMIPAYIYGIKYERVAPPQLDNTLEVASGTVEHSGFNAVTVAGTSSSYKTISFGKTFSKIPQVVVQEHNNSLNNYGAIGISVSYVTTTGFNLYAHGVPQTTLSGMSYDWIAMAQTGE